VTVLRGDEVAPRILGMKKIISDGSRRQARALGALCGQRRK
jgi:hypothetical protein